ncbi:hypothetical protein TSAR_000150 [Trichomalopsis sarcophagae]|uniref:Uncharacterized protein n=1 Tax=Trichomalopsis sarcophagae TaxID=543379 RepID=A0A232EGA2_9HYME|nr:hypothetical protein TSAR_000150 [Trichomalopsis sarcophagae]
MADAAGKATAENGTRRRGRLRNEEKTNMQTDQTRNFLVKGNCGFEMVFGRVRVQPSPVRNTR